MNTDLHERLRALGDFAILGSVAASPSGDIPILLIAALVIAAAGGLLAWRGEAARRSAARIAAMAGRETAMAGQSHRSRNKRRVRRDRR